MTVLLTRRDVGDLLTIDDCILAVENAFRLLGRGEVARPAIAGVHAAGGAFHIKAAIAGDRFAAKMNSNFFEAKPRIKGVMILCDATDGRVLAVMDQVSSRAPQSARDPVRKHAGDPSPSTRLGMTSEAVPAPTWADIILTCTPSRTPILNQVRPGTFVAAVGADSEEKQEIAPELMARSKVVTDLTDQCATIGDLHHPIAAGRGTGFDFAAF